jgi:hypothetical protein
LPYLRLTFDAKLSAFITAAATAIFSIANPRRHPAVNHDPLQSLDVRPLSARRKGPVRLAFEVAFEL